MVKRELMVVLLFALCTTLINAQGYEKLTLEDIYQNNLFQQNSVQELRWMMDGNFYTSLVQNQKTNIKDIIKFFTTTGEIADTLVHGENLIPKNKNRPLTIDSYQFVDNESKILISTETTKIYRRSSKAVNYLYDLNTQQLKLLVGGDKQSYATLSPDGTKVGFVRNNNLYIVNLTDDKVIPVTTDGKKNEMINGFADWVYEEELSLSKAFFWSPDGSKMAYLKFDESEVPMYNLQKWNGLYPKDYKFKYPKAGEKNSTVSVHVYDLDSNKTTEISVGNEKDVYIARLQWLPTGDMISVIRLNRMQNKLDVFHCDANGSTFKLAYSEQSKTYIDIDQVDDLTYLSDGKSFIISSEKSGFKHLYHYSNNGELVRQITKGSWGVTDFEGIDERKNMIYYTSTEVSSMERHLYVTDIKGRKHEKLSVTPGTHSASFSPDFKYYINAHSSTELPSNTALYNAKGKMIKVLAENEEYAKKSKQYGFAKTEYFQIHLDDGDSLNGYIMKPIDFESNKRYPVLMYVYGGPGSQSVMNQWNSNPWHHYLTQQGYIVACVDNRGTGGKGRDFQHITYKRLGKYESEDQIAGAKYLASLPYIDQDRIGIWGWSYGGYVSSLSLLLGSEIFKAAIAVAPVTNWRFYDTIYTERYLQKPQDNPSGYDDYSPQHHAEKLKGNLLLIHGTGDDNVHFQNTVEFQNALIRANKQFNSFFYPDRNHSIYGGNTYLHLYTMMTNFILEKL